MSRIADAWDRLRSGLTLLAICTVVMVPVSGVIAAMIKWGVGPWGTMAAGIVVGLVEGYAIGAYLHEDELPALPLQDDEDYDEWGPYGAGRQA